MDVAESQVSAGSTRFQGESTDSGPSRERLDRPAATSPLTFAEVSAVNRQRAARWHPGFPDEGGEWSGADWSNAMCGEAGEVANVVKKLRRSECGFRGVLDGDPDVLRSMLADEIADVYCYLDLLATYYRVDVPGGAVAWLLHTDEHGGQGLGAGRWLIRRQQEWSAAGYRRVSD